MNQAHDESHLAPELAESFQRDREVWDACAPNYEDQIVLGHPDVQGYLGFEEDLLDRLLLYLVRDCGREVRLHDVGCGSGRLHLRYGRQFAPRSSIRSEPYLAARLKIVSGLDFSAQMLALAHRSPRPTRRSTAPPPSSSRISSSISWGARPKTGRCCS